MGSYVWSIRGTYEPDSLKEVKQRDKKVEKTTEELGGTKYDVGKTRPSLFPKAFLLEVSKVLTFGAEKYDAYNWTKGFKASRLLDSLSRHMVAWEMGQDKDPESGISHLAHAACNLAFLFELQLSGKLDDDRYTQPYKNELISQLLNGGIDGNKG